MKPVSLALLLLASLLSACGGGAAPTHADDEVSATWTAGDDIPLEEADAGPREAGSTAAE